MNKQKKLELLEQAWALIDEPEKWTQGVGHDPFTGAYCSTGAIRSVVSRDRANDPGFYTFLTTLSEECQELYKEFKDWRMVSFVMDANGDESLIEYNDSHSYEDIRDLWLNTLGKLRGDTNG